MDIEDKCIISYWQSFWNRMSLTTTINHVLEKHKAIRLVLFKNYIIVLLKSNHKQLFKCVCHCVLSIFKKIKDFLKIVSEGKIYKICNFTSPSSN